MDEIEICNPICGDGLIIGNEICDTKLSSTCVKCLREQSFEALVNKSTPTIVGVTTTTSTFQAVSSASKLASFSPAMFI